MEARGSRREIKVAAAQYIKERDYWLNRLSGGLTKSGFDYDHSPGEGIAEGDVSTNTVEFKLSGRVFSRLLTLSKGSDYSLHVILVTGIFILLYKYTGSRDMIVATPIYRQDTEGQFINTVLPLAVRIEDDIPFKEMLRQMGQTVLEAVENQNYPVELLPELLGDTHSGDDFSLFEVAVLLENIQEKGYLQGFNPNILFSFFRADAHITGKVEYRSSRYDRERVEKIGNRFVHLLQVSLAQIEIPIGDIDILPDWERRQLLYGFNDTDSDFPRDRTIHQLFEEQVDRTPDRIAVVGTGGHISYRGFKQYTGHLALILIQKGVGPADLVAIWVERSLEMMVGIFAILKAGGAYLPIEPSYPAARVSYMLADSQVSLLLTSAVTQARLEAESPEPVLISPALYTRTSSPMFTLTAGQVNPLNPAYVIYTSGSTGKPKGVMIRHRSVVNRLNWMQRFCPLDEGDVLLQKTFFVFDVSVWELFWWSFYGARLCLLQPGEEGSPPAIIEAVASHRVTTIHFVPSMLHAFLESIEEGVDVNRLAPLKRVFASGEALTVYDAEIFNRLLYRNNGTQLINLYGPTEATVDVSVFPVPAAGHIERVPIGKPIDNIRLYVLDRCLNLVPPGTAGELCIAGEGLAAGYLNRPELTARMFVDHPFAAGRRLYRTGDLARWLANGEVEFLGRIDDQIKIKGFRIELGEIKNRLLKHEGVKEAEVIVRRAKSGDPFICAYIVGTEGRGKAPKTPESRELTEYLSAVLPDYMVPTHLLAVDRIPRTVSGKVDRQALPEPEMGQGDGEYVAPRDEVERKLAALWAEVLEVDRDVVGLDANFLKLGGHSLRATRLVARIYREFGVMVPMVDILKRPTVREMSQLIGQVDNSRDTPIRPVSRREYYPASSLQERLFILYEIGEINTAYNLTEVMKVEGRLDRHRLGLAFQMAARRHESLRTSFAMIGDDIVQRVHEHVDIKIEHYRLTGQEPATDRRPADSLIRDFVRPFDLLTAPLMRVGLIEIDTLRHILMVDIHHIVSDGTSLGLLVGDVMGLYEGRTLPQLKMQYRDFCQWQRSLEAKGMLAKQEQYWLERFNGEVPKLHIYTDYPRPQVQSFVGDHIHFTFAGPWSENIYRLCDETETTLYMVLLAAYTILLARYSGQEDIVVGTPTAGRNHEAFRHVVGIFINALAMRNFPRAHKSFIEFLREIKENTLQAYENQDYPFGELMKRVGVINDISRNPIFEAELVVQNLDVPRVEVRSLTLTPFAYAPGVTQVDIALYVREVEGAIHFCLTYCTALFKRTTMERFVASFRQICQAVGENRELKIGDIEVPFALTKTNAHVYEAVESDFQF